MARREKGDRWWCLECERFVESDYHRCEQWSVVTRIPKKAIDKIKKER